jgi:hypothetical protein
MRWLYRGPPPDRVGRRQKQVRRALLAAGDPAVSTAQLFEWCWPRLDPDARWPLWRWYTVTRAASRYAVPMNPRTRPLMWRARPGAFDELRRRKPDRGD